MENKVYLSYGAMITPIGSTIEANYSSMVAGKSGVQQCIASGFKDENWFISKINWLKENHFDNLLIAALEELKKTSHKEVLAHSKTRFIISSTKGNIAALPADVFASTRTIIEQQTGNKNTPIIISNACISGVIAINTAADYIRYSDVETVIVIGIDTVSDFITFGFQSLFALSDEPSQPFDGNRKGISLGEACGIIVATKQQPTDFCVEYLNGASSNDANHISGPSRTGEGLYRAVNKTIEKSFVSKEKIDFISAHGTGTIYNDEMESIAFTRCELSQVPLNSLKGYFGHTLGAAGVIETMVCLLSMEHQLLFKSIGFETKGTSETLSILTENKQETVHTVLKTASGFGGGNAALILKNVSCN